MTSAQEIFEKILKKRGIEDIEAFINPRYEDLADPMLMPDMSKAVERIQKAIAEKEKVAIYGDYDIDGMTATTILSEALEAMGAEVVHFIPSRFIDGYGMGKRGVDELAGQGVGLIITVDTGSMSHEHIDYAKTKNIDVIVTDHHTVGDSLPNAVAVINPKRDDSQYPYKELAGVGVAFTLIRALQKSGARGLDDGQEKWLLDLVAMGTVCDVVPLTGENRILVYWGLKVLAKTKRLGLKALAEVSDVDIGQATPETFGFRFGPRLNASGRLDTAKLSMNLLAARTKDEADTLAKELDVQNTQRRALQNEIFEQAHTQAAKNADNILVVSGVGWSHGVVGIVASKLMEEFERPVFVLGIDEQTRIATGSARSFGGYHLAKAIQANRDLIEKGGGHAVAAGITIKEDKIPTFSEAVNHYFKGLDIDAERVHLGDVADLELDTFDGLNDELIELLEGLQPFGNQNPRPLFSVRSHIESWRSVGSDQSHLKIRLIDDNGEMLDGIGFGMVRKLPDELDKGITATISVEHNEWNGRKTVQAKLINIRE